MYNLYGEEMVYATVKKWGNSFGVLLPVEYVRNKKLCENELVEVEIRKKNLTLKELFGTLKRTKSAQRIKDEMRAGWNS